MDDDFTRINEAELDREWLGQSRLAFKYGDKKADAKNALDRAESNLELVEAEMWLKVRQQFEDYGFDKSPTEKDTKAKIVTLQNYKDALDRVHKAKHAFDVYTAALNAVEHRKRALESLVDLTKINYHAEPRAAGSREEFAEAARDAQKARARKPLKGGKRG